MAELLEEVEPELDETHLPPTETNEEEGFQKNSEQLEAELKPEEEKPVEPEVKAKTPSRLQSRIDQLVAGRSEAERRAQAAEGELNQLKAGYKDEPKEEDFEHYRDYVKAAARFEVQQTRISDATQHVTESVQQIQTHNEEYQKIKMNEGVEAHADFAEKAVVLGQIFKPGMEAYDALFESTEFTDVAYFLSNNLAEAVRIANLPPRAQTREIFKLEAGFESGRQPTAVAQDLPKQAKSVSAAPAPARQVLTGKTGVQRLSPDKESMDQYAARRQKELRPK